MTPSYQVFPGHPICLLPSTSITNNTQIYTTQLESIDTATVTCCNAHKKLISK